MKIGWFYSNDLEKNTNALKNYIQQEKRKNGVKWSASHDIKKLVCRQGREKMGRGSPASLKKNKTANKSKSI